MPLRIAALLLLLASLAAGCATRPPGPPPLTASPAVAPNFVVPTIRERMVFLARQEWALFGRPVAARNGAGELVLEFPADVPATYETQPPLLSRVLLYWYEVTRTPIVGDQGELRPWSAAFISWLVRGSGLTADEFPPAIAHWDYIRRSLARADGERFVARDPAAYAPRPGDLVCISRDDAVRSFAGLRRGPYHCDLVVESGNGAVEAIGGNVGDAVALTRADTDERGILKPRPDRPWVVVLEQRDTR